MTGNIQEEVLTFRSAYWVERISSALAEFKCREDAESGRQDMVVKHSKGPGWRSVPNHLPSKYMNASQHQVTSCR